MIFDKSLFVFPDGSVPKGIVIEENIIKEMEITRHPVQTGTPISDHRYPEPVRIAIRCAWDNPGLLDRAASIAQDVLSDVTDGFISKSATPQTINDVEARIHVLQRTGPLFDYMAVDGIIYGNMQIKSTMRIKDSQMYTILALMIHLEQVIVVSPASAKLPKEKQKGPAKTATPSESGNQQPKPVSSATPTTNKSGLQTIADKIQKWGDGFQYHGATKQ